ncbi:Impact [Macrophomina phaseolina MS6]|uniref:Impact n=1 Tax=Macrophomina phaseolina (strain MS6) TaxID=1126212 RepID=K2R8Z3_MACPH|nr:Impact [Macrophomina phaseolina MS6]
MNQDLDDEITSINSIYDESTLAAVSATPDAPSASTLCALRLPSLPSVTLRLDFPADYPDAPPAVLGTQSVGDDVPKGFGTKVVDVVRDVLARVYRAGEPCVFDLLEEVGAMVEREREALQEAAASGAEPEQSSEISGLNSRGGGGGGGDGEEEVVLDAPAAELASLKVEDLGAQPAWAMSEPLTEKKSVFLGRAVRVGDVAEAKRCIAHLLATDKKAARATHNITAWRIRGKGAAAFQDCDDDGETAAGGRVLHLLQLMDVWDVVVVVTRWYGGVQLGPDRFRLINQAARDAVVAGGFVKEEKKEGGGKKKGKK